VRAPRSRRSGIKPGALEHLKSRFELDITDFEPKVYWHLTDNWLELTVRLLTQPQGTRDVKDARSREVLAGFDAAGIGIASATSEIVGLPVLKVRQVP
jgi:hypothetical protein